MRLRFLGAARMVTGSCYLLEVGASKVMIDCGMFQGPREIRENNYRPFFIQPQSVDCLLLTHAHIDHSGLIPKLVKHGFRGKIYATAATVDLCSVMLPDAGYIQEMEAERLNRKNRRMGRAELEPIYTYDDALYCQQFFVPVNYEEEVRLTSQISVRFREAGHILGSSFLEIDVIEGKEQIRLVFSGDLGNSNKPYLKDPSSLEKGDYLIMESTYGDRSCKTDYNRQKHLEKIVWEAYHKGGNLIIPAFAVERTQDLIYDFNLMSMEGTFPPMSLYIDSPMAVETTEIFKRHMELFDEKTKALIGDGNNPLAMPNLKFSRTTEESKALNEIRGGAIIISASGMCEAGRIKHHLRHNLWRPECTILFVGYQAPGTKGQRLKDGVKTIRIHGEEVVVKADIKSMESYSSHADQKALIEWVGRMQKIPKKIFLTHGEFQSASILAELLLKKFGAYVIIPEFGEIIELTDGVVAGEDKVRETLAAVAVKLNELLKTRAVADDYPEIVHKLNELDGLVESMKKKAV
jgi:metallo-beta-lactamase family protein